MFNNSLLKDEDYCHIIRDMIKTRKLQTNYQTDLFTWYDGLKIEIRRISITYGKQRQRHVRRIKKKIMKQVKHEREKLQKYQDYDISMLIRIENELDEVILAEMRGAALRSKIEWYEDGERSSKFFFNLEKSRQNRKILTKLVNDQGEVYYDQSSILRKQVTFYRNLYRERACDHQSQDELINNITRTLSQSDAQFCDVQLSSSDLKNALFSMESNKSPGNDGLTVEFFKMFWYDFIDVFERLIADTFSSNQLCDSMRMGTISLIPKKGDLTRLTNWRPISLLNVDYKILSKAIANRISKVIDTLVSEDQTCCIPGRDISENILTMINVINYVNDNNLKGLVLKIDQHKAFDCVNHDYLYKVIEKMGFGPNLLKWIKILYHNITACIKHNGYISGSFSINRGVRQGCPASALLYVLSAEPFHETICKSPYISGIQIGHTEARMFQHADDTTFFVSSITSIFSIMRVVKVYELASGSKCNMNKTELLVIGRSEADPRDFNFPVKNDFIVVLGIAMGNDQVLIEKENWENRTGKCASVLRRWKCRNLSFKGKAIVINSLVVSRLVYLATVLHIPEWVISTVRRILMDFMWRGKTPLISYKSLILPVNKGGLQLCDMANKRDALRIKYASKLMNPDVNLKLKTSMLYFLNHYEHMNLGLNIFHTVIHEKSLSGIPMFYQELLLAWQKLTKGSYVEPLSREEMLFQPIFHNPFIRDENNVTLFQRSFIDGEIILVSDLMYEVLPSRLPSKAIYDCITMVNPDDPISIDEVDRFLSIFMKALPEEWINEIFSSDKVVSTQSDFELSFNFTHGCDVLDGQRLTCKQASDLFRNELDYVPKGQEYWSRLYEVIPFENRWENIYRKPKCFRDADIEYKIMHNILFTNEKLYKTKMIDSPLCTFCSDSNETIRHLFIECFEVEGLWNHLTRKLMCLKSIPDHDQWVVTTLFGLGLPRKHKEGILIDFILNIYKAAIWKCRNMILATGRQMNIDHFFHNFLKKKINTIYEVYRKNQTLHQFFFYYWDRKMSYCLTLRTILINIIWIQVDLNVYILYSLISCEKLINSWAMKSRSVWIRATKGGIKIE